MSLTNDQLEQAYQYIMQKGQSLAGLADGGTDLTRMYLAPVLKYNQGGTTASLVRVAVSLLQGADAFETWKKKTGNAAASFDDFLKEFKGEPFRFEDFTPDQLDGLMLKWEKLTEEQKDQLRFKFEYFTADEIKKLQEPATEATESAEKATTDANAAEKLRAEAEALRVKVEEKRVTTESERDKAEKERIEEEKKRAIAEAARIEEEEARNEEEKKRQADTTEAITNAEMATGNASDAADRLNLLSDHRDEIREGYWWRWNEETKEWYNTGERSDGSILLPVFHQDERGHLIMVIPERYEGPDFEVRNKNLIMKMNYE